MYFLTEINEDVMLCRISVRNIWARGS